MAASAHLSKSYWSADRSLQIVDCTTGEALRRTAAAYPERVALVEVTPPGMASLTGSRETARRWTYELLLAEAEQCANWLLDRFQPGEHITVWAPNVAEWVVLQYGAAMAGLVLVTANPALRENELRYVVEQSRSVGLFYVSEFRGTNMAAIATAVAPLLRETFCFSRWDAEVRGRQGGGPLPEVHPRDPAQIQYTSGTTGAPKGALLHHNGLVNNARFVTMSSGLDGAVILSAMPLFHTAGAVLGSLGCVTTASTYVLPLFFEPDLILSALERERCDAMHGVPTMLIAMLGHPSLGRRDLSSLRSVVTGGTPVPPELLKRVEGGFGCSLLNVFGQTEASPIIAQTRPDDTPEDKAQTVGRPLPQVEARIVAPASGEVQPIGVEGEIQARGYQVMLGYFGMPEQTASTLLPDGWLRTGDLGTLDSRGYLRVTGRLKDMIIRGGENIYPAEIEARLLEHPKIVAAAVFGLPDPKWGEVVAVAVQIRGQETPPTPAALKEHCRAALAPHKVPARWFVCEAFPLTGSGKIKKFSLAEMAAGNLLSELI